MFQADDRNWLLGALRTNYAVQRARTWYGRARNRIRSRNFLILGAARSGTSLLVDYLNCHASVQCHGEILGHDAPLYGNAFRWANRPFARHRLRLHAESFFVKPPGRSVGAKILTYHLDELPIKMSDLVDILDRPRMILIYRERLLDQFISLKMAERTGVWHTEQKVEQGPIWLDPAEYRLYADREARMWYANLVALKGVQVHCVTYEQLVDAPNETMRGVFEFLGHDPVACATTRMKVNANRLEDKLANCRQFIESGIDPHEIQQLPWPSGRRLAMAA
jgi:LPS sulfotransferase NodH